VSMAVPERQQTGNTDGNVYNESCGPPGPATVEQRDVVLRYIERV